MNRSTIRPPLTSWLGTLLVTLALASNLAAASKPVPSKISIVESYADRLVCTTEDGDVSCDTAFTDSFTITATITGVFTGLTAETTFEINLNGLDLTHALGDDSKYKPGKSTSATFVDSGADANDRPVVVDTIKLKWTTKQLTVTMTGKATADYGSTAVADNYVGNDSGKINDTVAGTITFGRTTLAFPNIAITGSVATKTVHAQDDSDYDLSTVSIKGSATLTAP